MYPQYTVRAMGDTPYENAAVPKKTKLLQHTFEFEYQAFQSQTAMRLHPQFLLDQPLHEAECLYPGVMDSELRNRYPVGDPPQQADVLTRDLGYPPCPPLPPTDIQRNYLYTSQQQQQLNLQQQQQDPFFNQQKKRWINPAKQPSVYSQYTPLCHEQHCKSNSTSSIYCNVNPKPAISELISGCAVLIFTQITQVHNGYQPPPQFRRFATIAQMFNESNYITTKSEDILEPRQVEAFIKNIYDIGQFQPETCVVTLIYLNRFLSRTGILLSSGNWKPLYMICLILSQKICDDMPLINKDFGIIYPPLQSIHHINALEKAMVDEIEFDLHVTSATFLVYLDQVKSVSRQAELRKDLFNRQVSLWHQLTTNTRTFKDPEVASLFQQCSAQNRPVPQFQTDPEYRAIYSSKHDFIPPLLGRIDQQRLHYTELYSYQRATWKKRVMTPEVLELADNKYKVQS